MLNVECYSAPQLFGLPYQHMMIDEGYKNASVCAIFVSPRVKTSPRVIGQSYTRRWLCAACPLYILPLFNVYRYVNDRGSRVLQVYASQPIIYSANESLNAISSVYIFAYGSKIVLKSFTGN